MAAVAAERDAAHERVQELRKERLLERAFSEAEGRNGGDSRGTFFQVFKGQLGESFRLTTQQGRHRRAGTTGQPGPAVAGG